MASLGRRLAGALASLVKQPQSKEYKLALPAGYPASQIMVRLSLPSVPAFQGFEFAEHAMNEMGEPTRTVLAATGKGFAVSDDLGVHWRTVTLKSDANLHMTNVTSLGDGEFLAQARPASQAEHGFYDLLIVDADGHVIDRKPGFGERWHSCRAVGHAGGTLMYAEYPNNTNRRARSRVLRSRDRARSWETVFERPGNAMRHFHFLQPRTDVPGEWWLTSGDMPEESRVWISRDDGDSWNDLTEKAGTILSTGGETFQRSVFRLTDLAWQGNEIIWGTDDRLGDAGARVFRSPIADPLAPRLIGAGNWHFRSIVEVGDFYILASQGCPTPSGKADPRPGVYLAPKKPVAGAPELFPLFDIEMLGPKRTKFTSSRASRKALDGTFFSFRGKDDVFAGGPRLLKWQVTFS
ncbi:MAG TPA: hypothetical protein VGG10_11990 [Rhizomicrobium sp.]|jgi:hypothetical protein